ncbi:hypothetical protein R6Q59_022167 [Mikania micrantha]
MTGPPDYVFYWSKWVSIKVNVFAWRAEMDRLSYSGWSCEKATFDSPHGCPLCEQKLRNRSVIFLLYARSITSGLVEEAKRLTFLWVKERATKELGGFGSLSVLFNEEDEAESLAPVNLRRISDGICALYERKLKELNPAMRNITYDIEDLYNFIDGLTDLSALVYDHSIQAYLPNDRQWIRQRMLNHLRKLAN